MELCVRVNCLKLYNGRRSFYLSLTIGTWRAFVSRWDTARVTLKGRQVDIWRGPIMTWYAGVN